MRGTHVLTRETDIQCTARQQRVIPKYIKRVHPVISLRLLLITSLN